MGKRLPYVSRFVTALAAALAAGIDVLIVYSMLASRPSRNHVAAAAIGGVVFTILGLIAVQRLARFRIASEATIAGNSLALASSRWSVNIAPLDVQGKVRRVSVDPIGPPFRGQSTWAPLWRHWILVETSGGASRPRGYLFWQPDPAALLCQLRHASFPVEPEDCVDDSEPREVPVP